VAWPWWLSCCSRAAAPDIMEPQAPAPLRDEVWDALQTALTVWGAYSLFVQVMQWTRKR